MFLRKGLEGVSIPQCGTFPLVGELVQLLNDPMVTTHLNGQSVERKMMDEAGGS